MGTNARGWLLSLSCVLAAACGKVERLPGNDGAPDIDADPGVDSGGQVDGSPNDPDARPLPTAPPVTNGQGAILVLGAPSIFEGSGGTAANLFRQAGGSATADGKMWIADIDNARVLQWDSEPVVNQEPADLVIGQTSFDTREAGPTNVLLTPVEGFVDRFADVTVGGGRLVIADGHANRVLIWNSLPSANGPPADMVLGQTTFTGSTAGVNANQLSGPSGVWTDGETLIVVDQLNNRALIWTSFPTANGQPADLVLGQTSFTSSAAPDPPTASSMDLPTDVIYDGERLYIVDSNNNRIMGWNDIPTETNAPADFFVGQPDAVSNIPNAGAGPQNPSAIGLHLPGTVTAAFGSLFVTDQVNFRVLVYSPRPATSGEAADAALGTETLDTIQEIAKEQQLTPRGVGVYGDRLYVSDSNLAFGTSRVMVYQLANLP
jgi:hypothetical protein